jgi:CheY-like chemotaxis protein
VVSEGMNKGTAFTIRLSVALHAPTVGRLDPFAFAFAPPGRMFSILIVDDNQAAAEALQKLLALRGHVVRVAYTAAAAIEKIEKYSPEVVLLDIGLPDMNGYDLAREIKRRGTQLSLIALTGYGQEADRIEAERAGFDHHLTKPIGLADIEIVLASLF